MDREPDASLALFEYRKKLDTIDSTMAKLFVERMHVVKKIQHYKEENGLPIQDSVREKEMLEARTSELSDPSLASYYAVFLQTVIALSRRYQGEVKERGCNE